MDRNTRVTAKVHFFISRKQIFCEISRKKVTDFQQNVCENLELFCKILKILFTFVCLEFLQESNPPRPLINSLKWVCWTNRFRISQRGVKIH